MTHNQEHLRIFTCWMTLLIGFNNVRIGVTIHYDIARLNDIVSEHWKKINGEL